MDFNGKFVLLTPTCFPNKASVGVHGEYPGVSVRVVQKERVTFSALCFL